MNNQIKQFSRNNKDYIFIILGILLIILITGVLLYSRNFTGNIIQRIEFFPCSDSDGGINYKVKGTIVSKELVEEDFCFTGDGAVVDYCKGRQCFLMEHYCNPLKDRNKPGGQRIIAKGHRNIPCYNGAYTDPRDVPQEVTYYSE